MAKRMDCQRMAEKYRDKRNCGNLDARKAARNKEIGGDV